MNILVVIIFFLTSHVYQQIIEIFFNIFFFIFLKDYK